MMISNDQYSYNVLIVRLTTQFYSLDSRVHTNMTSDLGLSMAVLMCICAKSHGSTAERITATEV